MDWREKYKDKLITAEQAARIVKSGDRISMPFISKGLTVLSELAKRKDELENVTLIGSHPQAFPWLSENMEPHFYIKDTFSFKTTQIGIAEKWIDWVPHIFGLTDGIRQLEKDRAKCVQYADVFIGTIGPPNGNGNSSFGLDLYFTPSILRTAKTKICEIQPNNIWTCGDYVHLSEIDYLVEASPKELPGTFSVPITPPPREEAEMAEVIGANIASLVRDGDTIQVGTGTSSGAVWQFLDMKNDLGVDTELMLAEVIDLIKAGNVNGKRNNANPGKILLTATIPRKEDPKTPERLAFIDHNPIFEFRDVGWLCNVPRIASNDNMIAVNAAVAIDLLGQAVITHIGTTPISGGGGGVEYPIGTHYSKGGRSVLSLLSTAMGGTVSRIVPQLESGALVSIPCYYVDYLVTEYGVVNLDGRSNRERAEAVISVAHPMFQPELRKAAKQLFYP